MVLPDGVRIEIISNGSVLPMYDDPDAAEMDQTSTPQHYIEAVTGATFSVRVVLTPAFVKGPCDAVRVVVGFDGNQGNCMDLLKGGVSPPLREAHFSLFSLWDFAKGHWSGGTPSFARLDTKETNEVPGVKIEGVQALGSIQVEIIRVRLLGVYDASPGRGTKRISEVPEKMLKGRAVENTVEYASRPVYVLQLTESSYANTYRLTRVQGSEQWAHISGPLSNTLKFNIMYRSKRSLQSLGCLPRSPSPESSPADLNPKEEIQQLRSRLALLERSINVKPEARSGHGSIKRERQDAETQASRKKPRRDASIEVVDLIDD